MYQDEGVVAFCLSSRCGSCHQYESIDSGAFLKTRLVEIGLLAFFIQDSFFCMLSNFLSHSILRSDYIMEQNWHTKTGEEILSQFNTSRSGIEVNSIDERKEKYGVNKLVEEKRRSTVLIFIDQFKDILVLILAIAIVISAASGEIASATVIGFVITINAIVGTVQTLKSEKALGGLKSLSTQKAHVIRESEKLEIEVTDVVVGDIMELVAGDIVPADGRVVESYNLQSQESALTGETTAVEKDGNVLKEEKLPLGDRINMLYSGSLITSGTVVAVVTEVGMETEIGKIAKAIIGEERKPSPLEVDLGIFNKRLSIFVAILCLTIFVFNLIQGQEFLDALLFAISLAVAAVPEVLAIVVTITLALGVKSIAHEKAVIKNLHHVETIGAISVICSDKTGTITQNKMTVVDVFKDFGSTPELNPSVKLDDLLLKASVLCNNGYIDGETQIGDPTETALLHFAKSYGLKSSDLNNKYQRINEKPFDSSRKMMSVVNDVEGEEILFVKGAPDIVLIKCTHVMIDDIIRPMLPADNEKLLAQNTVYASDGLRVLALAMKHGTDESELTLLGLFALQDPPREESKAAAHACHEAGVKPIMITGDHKETARSIAAQVGIFRNGDLCLSGAELDELDEDTFKRKLPYISVYARVTPEHKIKIVKKWQELGHTVAMTGDGVNDAPALKSADIGIAMGITGTEVSKDAASMILMDDNFATIVKAISNGRTIYENIKNSIIYLMTTNLATILCVLLTTFLFLPAPFLPVHLLFINLATDSLPAIAIGMEKTQSDLMKDKPRDKSKFILDKIALQKIVIEAGLIATVTMIGYYYGMTYGVSVAKTMAFFTMCLSRLCYGFNARGRQPLYKIGIFSNMNSIFAFLAGAGLLHLLLIVPRLGGWFEFSPVALYKLGLMYALSTMPVIIIQIGKQITSKKANI